MVVTLVFVGLFGFCLFDFRGLERVWYCLGGLYVFGFPDDLLALGVGSATCMLLVSFYVVFELLFSCILVFIITLCYMVLGLLGGICVSGFLVCLFGLIEVFSFRVVCNWFR